MFRHQGKSRTLKHNLRIATILSFVAGIVNVSGFLSFKQLTKNVEKYSFCKGIIRDNGEQILWQKEMQELLNNIIRK